MSWTSSAGLKKQITRLWEQGALLRSLVTSEILFPRKLILKAPTSAELAERFNAGRGWIADLVAIPHLRIEWREIKHRVHGAQRLPHSVWVASLDEALALIGKRAEASRFENVLALTRATNPALISWLAKRPLRAIELHDMWPRLLDVVAWMQQHPSPGIYLRQVDIPGVHSKFIETHRGVLHELLNLALPAAAISPDHSGASRFSARYGFIDKPTRIRLRVLDARLGLVPGPQFPDVTLDADSFAKLDVAVRRVFITENETNFLAFPVVPDAIVVFGAGYGWDALSKADWLRRCAIYYWGDIDTHGFAILDQLRRQLPGAVSFLMDRHTLMAHQALWGTETEQVIHDLPSLTADEQALYDELRDHRIRRNLRLEQEMIGFGFLQTSVAKLTG